MSATTLHATTKHCRALLDADAASVTRQLEAHHASVLASLHPHLDALYRDLEAHRKTLTDGAVVSLSWLVEQGRLKRIKALVAQHIDAYTQFASHVIGQSQHQALALGKQAAQAQLTHVLDSQSIAEAHPAKL